MFIFSVAHEISTHQYFSLNTLLCRERKKNPKSKNIYIYIYVLVEAESYETEVSN